MNPAVDFINGERLLINKPIGWTSFDVVNKIRIQLRSLLKTSIKVGHAGTLDPLATGLLIVCTGKFTKKLDEYQLHEKEYTGTFFLGATTPCFDLERAIDHHFPTDHISNEMIYETSKQFIGNIQQIPPIFSAVKVDGKRAYKKARRGEVAEIRAKEITIREFEITNISMPLVEFRIVCGKGTYIRSVARDFGVALGSGAHLTSLCRTRIGTFSLKDSVSITEFQNQLL